MSITVCEVCERKFDSDYEEFHDLIVNVMCNDCVEEMPD